MSSGRSIYSSAPAGTPGAIRRKPKPRRPKREINQLFLLLLFIVLPVVLSFLAIITIQKQSL